jgi:hypothetical protein
VESFNSRVRDELLSVEVFSCLGEAKVMVEDYWPDPVHRSAGCEGWWVVGTFRVRMSPASNGADA